MTKDQSASYVQGIPPGEPLFVLRAQDQCAPQTLRRWADLVEAGSMPDSPSRAKAAGARRLAQEMEDWQATHGSKVPD